jgi:hypothetical protein
LKLSATKSGCLIQFGRLSWKVIVAKATATTHRYMNTTEAREEKTVTGLFYSPSLV